MKKWLVNATLIWLVVCSSILIGFSIYTNSHTFITLSVFSSILTFLSLIETTQIHMFYKNKTEKKSAQSAKAQDIKRGRRRTNIGKKENMEKLDKGKSALKEKPINKRNLEI